MATETTRLFKKKSVDYLSNASITVDPKSRECIVVVPATYNTNSCENIDEFAGLTLEELYLYMDDPWWRLLRRSILVSFWILLLVIFATACIISIVEYKERCTINSIKSMHSAINLASIDVISRTNYTSLLNAMMASTLQPPQLR